MFENTKNTLGPERKQSSGVLRHDRTNYRVSLPYRSDEWEKNLVNQFYKRFINQRFNLRGLVVGDTPTLFRMKSHINKRNVKPADERVRMLSNQLKE